MNPRLIESPIVIDECARCACKTEREGQLESPAVLTRRSALRLQGTRDRGDVPQI
jgi:hypothetical protein